MNDEGLYVGIVTRAKNTGVARPEAWLAECGWDEWHAGRGKREETLNSAGAAQALCVRLPRWVRGFGAAKPGTTDLRQTLKAVRNAVEADVRAGRVMFLLAEFPHSFTYSVGNRLWLDRVLGELEGLPLVVGFWSAEWYTSRLIEGLKQRNVALCLYDAPRLPGLPPAVEVLTADRVYARFLSRNGAAWKNGQFGHVLDYRYTKKELANIVPRLLMWRRKAEAVGMVFANGRWAAESAALMNRLLSAHVEAQLPKGGGP
ncbi:MAG TPA: hypothetical protein DHU26_04325 [Spirochaetaceae bacterium]|nr:hypothetical protein [Spirochaetaceae bacterium]